MIGILILFSAFVWFLIGDRRSSFFKFLLIAAGIGFYIFFLKSQGANSYEIWEIFFSLKTK